MMPSLVRFSMGLATAFASLSTAHTVFTTLFINGVDQGDGTCIRMAKKGSVCTHPIAGGLDSPDMACGRDGQQAVAFTCPAPAGSKLSFEFRMWADASQPGSIDPSHLGSTAIYLKQVSNISSDSAAGPGWFKIYAEGYDTAAKKWATEKLIDNGGLLSIELPPTLPAGYYLARSEIVTIQNVTNDHVDPQFYVGCAQLFVQGPPTTPTVPPDRLVSIPGHVHASDPGLTFNIWRDDPSKTAYTVVGPAPFSPTAAPTPTSTNTNGQQQQQQQQAIKQTDGVIPADCQLKNANWCGAEVPAYADEAGCWASSADCFAQLDACYTSAPPTGSRGCRLWEDWCTGIQQGCRAGRWRGPPPFHGEGAAAEV
ncbi:glycoside hydrolase family 61 protein [Thermothielavioides terrestris NRRL 8126]|uniref:lytic cellulose monooxygenase (C4-dehydrogenating) n=1 Tax=Thermothielavioides terrestris (strain ATCC 38088 / NRRL 8126) TaxID=578455 RepID=G2QZU1_THETT|nr:glycoside hydrolase family 61 protein [Thermothielavioides terrestris NRRL 8126]AEO67396.1 glycoside hydrolase family 61 protein [Thermothielavioides terrestris NRRL 8126]